MEAITVSWPSPVVQGEISLPASKSESNRCLIIQALAEPGAVVLHNLSEARDTRLLCGLLERIREGGETPLPLYARDAGTTLRFVTALCAARGLPALVTGTERMMQRPVGPLTDALNALGASVSHPEREGFPPVLTGSRPMRGGQVAVRGDISSQFITALLLTGPVLPDGLTLEITGTLHSRPYVDMTLALMRHFGAEIGEQGAFLNVSSTGYAPCAYTVEADWSAASYWYAVAALSEAAEISLPGLRTSSLQGDSRIALLMEAAGVFTHSSENGLIIKALKGRNPDRTPRLIDFSHTPDLAQTVAVVAAALRLPWKLTGLQSLRIKETDRILALQQELAAIGAGLEEEEPGIFVVLPAMHPLPETAFFRTWEDHRMAMAFAPLSITGTRLAFDDGSVVAKSFPGFWQQLTRAGAQVS